MKKQPSCKYCGSLTHYSYACYTQRKPIVSKAPKTNVRTSTTVLIRKKRIRQQSDKERAYQIWKETVVLPYLIERDGNKCACCKRPALANEKLDIEHTLTKGSRPDLKRDLDNLSLMCRWPCHFNKTNRIVCAHI